MQKWVMVSHKLWMDAGKPVRQYERYRFVDGYPTAGPGLPQVVTKAGSNHVSFLTGG